MSILVAVLDADVLVPILSCDLLLSAFDEDLYRPVVTATILDEVERSLVEHFTHLDPTALRGRVAQVAVALLHHMHDEGDVTAATVATVNHKDRHVVAKRVRRPVTRGELIDQLAGSFPGLAAELLGKRGVTGSNSRTLPYGWPSRLAVATRTSDRRL